MEDDRLHSSLIPCYCGNHMVLEKIAHVRDFCPVCDKALVFHVPWRPADFSCEVECTCGFKTKITVKEEDIEKLFDEKSKESMIHVEEIKWT